MSLLVTRFFYIYITSIIFKSFRFVLEIIWLFRVLVEMKFKHGKSTKSTLSDKIADALTVKPRADIEDDQVFGTKPQTLSRADFSSSESEDETAISDFRKRNVNLLSEISKKYEGKIVSRRDIDNESGESSDSGDDQLEALMNGNQASDSDNHVSVKESVHNLSNKVLPGDDSDSDETTSGKEKRQKSDSEGLDSDVSEESDDYSIMKLQTSQTDNTSDDEDDDDPSEEGSDEDEGEGYDVSQMEELVKEQFEHVKRKNLSEEAKKGACVRNQLLIWEGLLEIRIHLQRCMNTANQMPMYDTFEQLKGNKDFSEEANTTKTNIANVLEKFLNLQSLLLKKYPETKALSSIKQVSVIKSEEKQDDDEEIPSDTDNEEIPSDTDTECNSPSKEDSVKTSNSTRVKKRKIEDYEKEIATSHKCFKTFRDTTIQKWNEKTRLATATNIKNAPTNTILQQISYILSDREKLVRRTQLKRSEYDIVGYTKPSEEDRDENDIELNPVTRNRKDADEYVSEIFDDSDFYHQLLRELIECKSADISDPVQLSRQWIALQQMRSKMKRKVDTKATKGRKIKYVVHNQLVNYMAPEKCTTWNDDNTNELYSSLFGKMFERNNVELAAVENGFKLKN